VAEKEIVGAGASSELSDAARIEAQRTHSSSANTFIVERQ